MFFLQGLIISCLTGSAQNCQNGHILEKAHPILFSIPPRFCSGEGKVIIVDLICSCGTQVALKISPEQKRASD